MEKVEAAEAEAKDEKCLFKIENLFCCFPLLLLSIAHCLNTASSSTRTNLLQLQSLIYQLANVMANSKQQNVLLKT